MCFIPAHLELAQASDKVPSSLLCHAVPCQPSHHPGNNQAAAQESATEGIRVDYSENDEN